MYKRKLKRVIFGKNLLSYVGEPKTQHKRTIQMFCRVMRLIVSKLRKIVNIALKSVCHFAVVAIIYTIPLPRILI